MWGTFMLDAYRTHERRELAAALEDMFAPDSGTGWATAGIYLYWDFDSRAVLYVGLASDLPVRFAQHNLQDGYPASSCKRQEIDAYFASGNDLLGFTVIPLSELTQPSTKRFDDALSLDQRDLIDLQDALSNDALNQIRDLEGRLIAANEVRFGSIPAWNKNRARAPTQRPAPDDGTLLTATGSVDCLLQARRTLRGIASDGAAAMYEEYLHGVRLYAVALGILSGNGVDNALVRANVGHGLFSSFLADSLLDAGYLDGRLPITVDPVLETQARKADNERT